MQNQNFELATESIPLQGELYQIKIGARCAEVPTPMYNTEMVYTGRFIRTEENKHATSREFVFFFYDEEAGPFRISAAQWFNSLRIKGQPFEGKVVEVEFYRTLLRKKTA